MGLSRNKVAVPEGAAGTPPFWRAGLGSPAEGSSNDVRCKKEDVGCERCRKRVRSLDDIPAGSWWKADSLLAQLVRAPH